MKHIYDVITKQRIYGKTLSEISKKINAKGGSVSRLIRGEHKSLAHRYIANEAEGFILIDIDTQEEYHCADKKTFFILMKASYEENIAKYIYEVVKGRQKTFSFMEKIFCLKGSEVTRASIHHQSKNSQWYQEKRKFHSFYKNASRKLRLNLWRSLQRKKQKKSDCFNSLVGCSTDFLMGWIEKQFQEGMTWENWGREFHSGQKSWHIDHIIPCNTFDLSDINEQKKCFHYTNLRPLWETDNLKRPKDGSDIIQEDF